MPFTVTQPMGRVPTYPELQSLAREHEVQINGDAQAGDFHHPDAEKPKVTGNYTFEPNGDLRGEFVGHILGKLTGSFVFRTGKAEITITAMPFLLPEAVLKSKLTEGLAEFCSQFPSAA